MEQFKEVAVSVTGDTRNLTNTQRKVKAGTNFSALALIGEDQEAIKTDYSRLVLNHIDPRQDDDCELGSQGVKFYYYVVTLTLITLRNKEGKTSIGICEIYFLGNTIRLTVLSVFCEYYTVNCQK